jgi:N,N'-diacetyllegionaminate synthase
MKKPIFIAEVGMNYNTNFAIASELIKQASIAGADIVKFQLGWRDKPGEINVITKENIEHLVRLSSFYNIELMFSVISMESMSLFKEFSFKSVKIASRTVKEPELFNLIRSLGLNTYISFGMSEVKEFIDIKGSSDKFLYCISQYPTYYWDLREFPSDFPSSNFDGYSDHTLGIEACLYALSRGAQIIEKHFTLDKSETLIRDHALSATPEEFRDLVRTGTELYRIYNTLNNSGE